jgi:hypothetical protein
MGSGLVREDVSAFGAGFGCAGSGCGFCTGFGGVTFSGIGIASGGGVCGCVSAAGGAGAGLGVSVASTLSVGVCGEGIGIDGAFEISVAWTAPEALTAPPH